MKIDLTDDMISDITKESLKDNYKSIYESFIKCQFTQKGTGLFSYEFEEEVVNLCEYLKSFKDILEYYGVDTYLLDKQLRKELEEQIKLELKEK